jgi:hypothetical protein
MAESPDEKPVFRFVSVIEIESGTCGVLRFRNWTVNAGSAIEKVCNANVTARRFAEELFVQLSTDPVLTEADVQQWTEVELLDVAVKWWNVVEHQRWSPIEVDSLFGFQNAVRRRNAENRESFRTSIEQMAALRFDRPERSAIERLTESIAKTT